MLNNYLSPRKIIIALTVLLAACKTGSTQSDYWPLKIEPTLSNDFFDDTIFFETPSNVKVYSNDSLDFSKNFVDSLKSKKIANAFIADSLNKRFGFKECIAYRNSDTVVIKFISLPTVTEYLTLKIIDKRVLIDYRENLQENTWNVCAQNVVLKSEPGSSNKRTLGLIDLTLSKNEKCLDDKVHFSGPFYFSIDDNQILK